MPIENVVSVEGNVYNPGLITHSGRKSIKRYISLAGGMKKDSIISDIYVQRANGKIKRISRLNGLYTSAKAGDRIIVPVDTSPQDFDTASFVADILSVLTNLVAILAIVDNQKD